MTFKTRGFVVILFLLALTIIRSSGQVIRPTYQHSELPLEKQVALSRGAIGKRPELHELFKDGKIPDIDELIVMTFNMCHGVNQEGEEALDGIIKSIGATNAHIIALQEVDNFMPRSGFKDQAKEIAESLGYYYIYGETINILGVKYGNAIISKFPILGHENLKLPGDSIEPRGLLSAKIDIEGNILEIYTTHLGLNTQDRKEQIRAINSSIEELPHPFILMGDFNGEPSNIEMQELIPSLKDIATETQSEDIYTYAFHSYIPNTRIDRIYISQQINAKDHYVIDSNVSDHLMVLGVISINSTIKEGLTTSVGNNKFSSEVVPERW